MKKHAWARSNFLMNVVGLREGTAVVGMAVGITVVGMAVGMAVGLADGIAVGAAVGTLFFLMGELVGLNVGETSVTVNGSEKIARKKKEVRK